MDTHQQAERMKRTPAPGLHPWRNHARFFLILLASPAVSGWKAITF